MTDEPWAVIVTGGDPLVAGAAQQAPPGAFVIAADSGLDHALQAGLRPDLLVGDLDSVSPDGVAWARDHDLVIEQHPADKDLTDTAIALAAAVSRGFHRVLVLGGGGDRLDHSIGALVALGDPILALCAEVQAIWGTARVRVLHAPRSHEVAMPIGATFSLLALHGRCAGISLTGARWPLTGAILEPASSLGISNLAVEPVVRVSVGTGVLTLVIPHTPLPLDPSGASS